MGVPEFGHEADVNAVTKSYRIENIPLYDGLDLSEYNLRLSNVLNKKNDICSALGIAKSGVASVNKVAGSSLDKVLSSVVYTREEIVSVLYEPVVTFNVEGGASPSAANRLTYAACVKWIRVRVSLEITGKGRIPTEFATRGATITSVSGGIVIKSLTDETRLIDTADIFNSTGVDLKVKDVTGNENNEDWNEWSVMLEGFVTAADEDVSPLLGDEVTYTELEFFGALGVDISGTYTAYKVTITERYTAGDTHVSREEAVECYDDTDSVTIAAISYPA